MIIQSASRLITSWLASESIPDPPAHTPSPARPSRAGNHPETPRVAPSTVPLSTMFYVNASATLIYRFDTFVTHVTATIPELRNQSRIVWPTVTSVPYRFVRSSAMVCPTASAGPPGLVVIGWRRSAPERNGFPSILIWDRPKSLHLRPSSILPTAIEARGQSQEYRG